MGKAEASLRKGAGEPSWSSVTEGIFVTGRPAGAETSKCGVMGGCPLRPCGQKLLQVWEQQSGVFG